MGRSAPALAPSRAAGAVWIAVLLVAGCAGPRSLARPPVEPFHLSEMAARGDAQRRASTRLLLRGLADDAEARPERALAQYERALEVDATNPWAYLVLARHHAEGVSPARAYPFLDKAEALLAVGEPPPPGVEAHLLGLRGRVLHALGRRREAEPLLTRARRLAPGVWGDARLDAGELL